VVRIESQLDFALRHGGDALSLFSAYEYIRTRQLPELRDPLCETGTRNPQSFDQDCNWVMVRQAQSRAAALATLNLDPMMVHSQESIRRRYLELCLLHHPDKPCGNHNAYLQVRDAYEFLMEDA